MKNGLNRNQIKYIVIIAMLIDHIAWLFVPAYSAAGELMHFVGRLTGPVMAVFIAEGYIYTKDIKKYFLRLAVFSVISWPCFSLMEYNRLELYFSMISTLMLSLIGVRICDTKADLTVKVASVVFLCILSVFCDWSIFGILYSVNSFIFHDDSKRRWVIHTALSLLLFLYFVFQSVNNGFSWYGEIFQLGALMTTPLLSHVYNGDPGSAHLFHKCFFYIFYPFHMLIL